MLKNNQECLKLLEKLRWQGTPTCPYCGSIRVAAIKKEHRYHCNNCFTSFSVTVSTLFHKTHVDLTKWFQAIPLVLTESKSISVRKLAKEIEVNKNTANYMIVRILKAKERKDALILRLVSKLKQQPKSPKNL